MDAQARVQVPSFLGVFQGFQIRDVKHYRFDRRIELHLERIAEDPRLCAACGFKMDRYHDSYKTHAKHLKIFDNQVTVHYFKEKHYCHNCRKVRSELVPWISPTSPHITLDLAWWISQLAEVATVLQTSHLVSVDKMACYKVDKEVLLRLLQGYQIPQATHLSVDEVYARSKKQLKDGEDRDDLFLTVIVDQKTRKAIWVSPGRKKDSLDTFFTMIGPEQCRKIQSISVDQHPGYQASIKQFCPNTKIVWDRFHIVQIFNEHINDIRKEQWDKYGDPEGDNLLSGRNKWLYLTKARNRSQSDTQVLSEVMARNQTIQQIELIKEHFHKIFDCPSKAEALIMLSECYQWAFQTKSLKLVKFFDLLRTSPQFLNYFDERISSGVSEGINRAIKTLKWVAYGYKDMVYFALKIMQRQGYLNSKYAFGFLSD
jgi:transposase